MVDDDVEDEREVNLEAISSEYGGGLLEKNGDEKFDKDEKDDNVEKDGELDLMESEVDVTLKKRNILTDEDINESAFKMVINIYTKSLIQYFDAQYRDRLAKE
ncbi:hypothetical protein GIB67_019943 [Kingdonia uniflora]|uniref:Uncharacterized protein n=1 Tax=Kingdonia uniflora TaxID=39325 RepID=A0A7J7MKN6_9MAGN|nr:hypothetical protein GIB67_019943 [Kingdonia uniflora]